MGLSEERRDDMAIINVSPDTDITAFVASAAVSEGDVLLLAQGTYDQAVVISKNYVRLVSKTGKAVFEGSNLLANAFSLNGVTGVEIYGVTIRNYLTAGVMILGGTGNRIVHNKISNVSEGIYVTGSSANLIWKNQIEDVFDGVLLINGSTNNWVIENAAARTTDDGFEAFLSNDQNNAFLGNLARKCGGNCFEIFGVNCLALSNAAVEGTGAGYLIAAGSNIAAIENKAVKSGDGVRVTSLNAFLALNELKNNNNSGLEIVSDFNIAFWNQIVSNRDSGLVLGAESNGNFIFNNRVECNTPSDIVAGGTDNNILRNITGCPQDCRS